MSTPVIVQKDPWLEPYRSTIEWRTDYARNKEKELLKTAGSISDFADGYLYFGLHRHADSWKLREWAPNATAIYMIGEMNGWREEKAYELHRLDNGVWEISLPLEKIKHAQLYKLMVHWPGGQGERIPAWCRRVVQDKDTLVFNAQVWSPEDAYFWKHPHFQDIPANPLIYEAHIGMASEEEKVGTYEEFRVQVLPRIVKAGYNVLQLMAIQEHPYYGSFGYHVSSFFASSSRFGKPEDLKRLIDEAHEAGIAVIMDIVHSHAVRNEVEGLGKFDGTRYQYFHEGKRGEHTAWDSYCFNYGKNEVLHFLLSNCKYWIEEFNFDGFRFDGVTSMIYYDHGLSRDFSSYDFYFDGQQDEDAISYFILANKLIHELKPRAITVAEDMSGMPGLAAPIEWGGMGFDFRLSMGVPDFWIKIIKEKQDEEWDVSQIYYELTRRRSDEKTISYAESHDQALVGDKTIIFRLIDKEMYFFMSKQGQNLIVDRGMALHKMIRLITLSTAGSGYLNFMGNEFGHPEWIDFPREGNNWSYKYAKRQWSLMDRQDLRYHFLSDFDREMIHLIRNENLFLHPYCYLIQDNKNDQVLAYTRGDLLFIFNFNPEKAFTDYGIPVASGKYRVVLNSDSSAFGGFERIDDKMLYYTLKFGKIVSNAPNYLKVYLPPRCAIVFKKIPTRSIHEL